MAKAKSVDVVGIFQAMQDRNRDLASLKEQVKAIEKEIDLMEQQLYANIPANMVVNGLQHVVFTKRNVSYAKVLEKVKSLYVPKTKLAEVEAITEEFTSISETHKIKAV
jgi:hypothetical protein